MPQKSPLETRLAIIAFAAFFAVSLPWAWIDHSDTALHRASDFNFHPLLIVVYAPLAFGIVWPAMIYLMMCRDRANLVWPKNTALVLFCVCSFFSVPIIALEASSHNSGLEAIHRNEVAARKNEAEFVNAKLHASLTLESSGIDSLPDPLSSAETAALDHYIENHPLAPDDFVAMSRKYRTTMDPMLRMAKSKSCPTQALDIIFENLLELRGDPPSPGLPTSDLVEAIASNPNASPSLLVRILQTPRLFGQVAALTNPKLPADEKIAYLKRCAESKDWQDWQTAANNPDTPPSVLVKLLEGGEYSVSGAVNNPRVPEPAKVAYVHKLAMSGM